MAVTDDAPVIDQKSFGGAIDTPLDRHLTIPIDRHGNIGIAKLGKPSLGKDIFVFPIEADDGDVAASGDL
jgi:hypothetical protein